MRLGHSPLSRLVELEVLLLGVHGKIALWRSLQQLQRFGSTAIDLRSLLSRAERQLGQLEAHRLRAAAEALA
jgi:tRNA G37 N-methylase TrmD